MGWLFHGIVQSIQHFDQEMLTWGVMRQQDVFLESKCVKSYRVPVMLVLAWLDTGSIFRICPLSSIPRSISVIFPSTIFMFKSGVKKVTFELTGLSLRFGCRLIGWLVMWRWNKGMLSPRQSLTSPMDGFDFVVWVKGRRCVFLNECWVSVSAWNQRIER